MAKKAPPASAKADVDPNFERQIKELQNGAAEEAKDRTKGNSTHWMMPDKGNWSGDLFDYAGMAKPFDRSISNQNFVDAIKDPQNPGVSGDMIVTTLQIDWLACAERAFRSRHTFSRPRAIIQMCGRKNGHGQAKGPLTQAVLEFIRGLVKESKAKTNNELAGDGPAAPGNTTANA